ncbi:hypothetical protein VPH35_086541 [Triticum aestivum]
MALSAQAAVAPRLLHPPSRRLTSAPSTAPPLLPLLRSGSVYPRWTRRASVRVRAGAGGGGERRRESPYEVLARGAVGVARGDQARVPAPRAQVPPGRQQGAAIIKSMEAYQYQDSDDDLDLDWKPEGLWEQVFAYSLIISMLIYVLT